MKAVQANFLKFLGKPQQFVIPIYQRTYDWRLQDCQQLWNDILAAGRSTHPGGHFIGSIVYILGADQNTSQISQLMVIDGQQRLTTVTLLITALAKAVGAKPGQLDLTKKKLENYYLFNSEEEDDQRFKLLLTKSDRDTLLSIVEDRELPEKAAQRMLENYSFFNNELKKSKTDLAEVYAGLSKLMIVDVILERGLDNPQLIFESLNATGLNLSQADLIRNYLLMDLEPKEQTRIYQDRWFPMEQSFGRSEYLARFDAFMRDYLTVRQGRIPNLRDIYTEFKSYMRTMPPGKEVESVADDLHQFSKFYVKIALGKEADPDLKSAIDRINRLRVDVAYPFLVELYQDFEEGLFNKADFLRMLVLVESYVFRRAICGVPPNSLNNSFASLHRDIDPDRYVESFEAALLVKDSYRRFPRDAEFEQAIQVKDVYNFRSRNYLLERLENHGRKEIASVESYTIEHILPQNPELRSEWREVLGPSWRDVQARWLHTLGNLTLTGYNSEYSDRPFEEKRDIKGGFKESPLRLNQGIGSLSVWNEEAIVSRASALAKRATEIWPQPFLNESILAELKITTPSSEPEEYEVEGHSGYLHDDLLHLFEELSRRILNLDSCVRVEPKKLYIAFKAETNFVDVVPQKKRLRLILNMPFSEVDDPTGICRDITGLGKWGNGDVEASIEGEGQIDDAMHLIRQAFDRQVAFEGGDEHSGNLF